MARVGKNGDYSTLEAAISAGESFIEIADEWGGYQNENGYKVTRNQSHDDFCLCDECAIIIHRRR